MAGGCTNLPARGSKSSGRHDTSTSRASTWRHSHLPRVFDRADLGVGEGDGPWSVVSSTGELLAVYASHGSERAKPTVVLVPS
jgi:hypothetical protein